MNSAKRSKRIDSIKPAKGESLFSCKEGDKLICSFDIDELIKGESLNPNESFVMIGETSKHQFFLYKTMKYDRGFVLKRKKGTTHLRYFRRGLTYNFIYMDHLIQADESDYSNNMAVYATRLRTKRTKRYNWFSKNNRPVADFASCCDEIKGITVNEEGKLDILVHRYETASPSYDAEHNYEMDYHLMVTKSGFDFQAIALYPPRQETKCQSDDSSVEKPKQMNSPNKDYDETKRAKEKDPLQNQQETARMLARLMQHCGCNFVKPSMADKIVSMVIILPLKYKNKFPFTNKYVLADAAILGMLYAISIKSIDYEDDDEFDAFVGESMEKLYRGIMEMYEVDRQSLLGVSGNRIDFFQPIITDGINNDEMDRFYKEAATLFGQDITNNSLIQINEDIPLPLFDIDQKIQIEVETIAHFSTLFKMLENI